MTGDNSQKSTTNKKRTDKKFRSKHVKHDPNAESSRAVFGTKKADGDRSGVGSDKKQ